MKDIVSVIKEVISEFNKTVFTELPQELFDKLRMRKYSDEANRNHMKVFVAKDGKEYVVTKVINEDRFNVYASDNPQYPIATAVFDVKSDYFSGYEFNQSIVVDPNYRRTGIATAITDFAEKFYNLPYKPTDLLSQPMQGFVDNRFENEINEEQENKNHAVLKRNGKRFWIGAANVLDGYIEEIHTYEEAERNDFHHSFYFSPNMVEKISDEECMVFWVDEDGINDEWTHGKIPMNIIRLIENQINIL